MELLAFTGLDGTRMEHHRVGKLPLAKLKFTVLFVSQSLSNLSITKAESQSMLTW